MTNRRIAIIGVCGWIAALSPMGIAIAVDRDHGGASLRKAAQAERTQADNYNGGACFNADDWGPAADRKRPCVTITRIWEDGSFCAEVADASGRHHAEVCEGNPRD